MENNTVLETILNNSSFQILEVLDENPDRCYISFLGKINEKNEYFVLKLKKKEFNFSSVNELPSLNYLKSILTDLDQKFNNDIYYKFNTTDIIENKCKVDLIYPADYRVIDKYRKKGKVILIETIKTYEDKIKPFILSIDPAHTQWIRNLLYNRTEKILYSLDNYFMIAQDYNTKDNESLLNCLGIPFNNTVYSLRDLNESHLDLLERFYEARIEMARIYNLPSEKVRCFIHYPPTFYYLHVHYLNADYESDSTAINRAHDLFSIINNIKLRSDYYQTVDLEISVQIGSKLHNTIIN